MPVALDAILMSMKQRSEGSVRNRFGEMRGEKLIHGDARAGYRLTQAGHAAAVAEIGALAA